eukprot:Em0040g24a
MVLVPLVANMPESFPAQQILRHTLFLTFDDDILNIVEALFDVKVVDTDAPSHRTRSPEAILESGAKEKKRVYEQAVVERKGNFTPIVLSVDGLLHREAEHFLKRMAANLAHKWEKPYSQTCGYVRARLAFAIIRATSLCLRGSRVKWRSGLGMDDGAPLYSIL